jgi:hypothetical protein
MRPATAGLISLLLTCAALPAGALEPDPKQRAMIDAYFSPQFVWPDQAIWRYLKTQPFLDGTLWCGQVNEMNSSRRYLGFQPFYVTLYADGVHEGAIMGSAHDDPTGTLRGMLKQRCGL